MGSCFAPIKQKQAVILLIRQDYVYTAGFSYRVADHSTISRFVQYYFCRTVQPDIILESTVFFN